MEQMINKIKLKNITIFSVDCVNPHIALESLLETSKEMEFGSIKLFSDIKPLHLPNNVDFIKIPRIKNLIDNGFGNDNMGNINNNDELDLA